MAGKNKTVAASAVAGPLALPRGRAWIEAELATSQTDLRQGPGGLGWLHNESKRPALEQWIAFLEALLALLPSA